MRTRFGLALIALILAGCGGGGTNTSASSRPSGVPAAGVSPTIDKILQNGYIRVGVLAGPPWFVQSTSGGSTSWSGSSWTLAQAVAKRLGVKLQQVEVGHDTKITSVQTGQIDISITPLSETPARNLVVDFVTYSVDGFCWIALASNNKVNTVDDFNRGDVIDAEISGGAQVTFVKAAYPKLQILQIVGAPGEVYLIEPILSKRADINSFDAPLVYAITKKYPQLKSIPPPAECIAHPILPNSIGWAIRKGDPAFKSFLEGIEKPMQAQLDKETADIVATLSG